MYYRNRKGIILAVTLVFIIVMAIIAGVSLALMTQQARVTEYQIKRIRAFYTAEAALTYVLEGLRTTPPSITLSAGAGTITPSPPILNGYQATVTYGAPGSGFRNTRTFNVTVDY